MEILNPYRQRIDAIDERLIALLRERLDVIEEVGHLKARHDIPSVLQDRVDAVRDNAVKMGAECGIDADFIYALWTHLITYACDLEDDIREGRK